MLTGTNLVFKATLELSSEEEEANFDQKIICCKHVAKHKIGKKTLHLLFLGCPCCLLITLSLERPTLIGRILSCFVYAFYS